MKEIFWRETWKHQREIIKSNFFTKCFVKRRWLVLRDWYKVNIFFVFVYSSFKKSHSKQAGNWKCGAIQMSSWKFSEFLFMKTNSRVVRPNFVYFCTTRNDTEMMKDFLVKIYGFSVFLWNKIEYSPWNFLAFLRLLTEKVFVFLTKCKIVLCSN